jgi:hypothetical protein
MWLLIVDDVAVREGLAANPNLPMRIMKRIAREQGSPALVLARRERLPDEIIAMLAWHSRSETPQSRYGSGRFAHSGAIGAETYSTVLGRRDCPHEVFELHARHNGLARAVIAENPACPPETLAYIAGCGPGPAKLGVARNPNTSEETLLALAGRDRALSSLVAQHPRATVATLEKALAGPMTWAARLQSIRRLCEADWERGRAWVTGLPPGRRFELVMNSRDARLATLMADDADWRLRYTVATATEDSELLSSLADDPHGRVRRAASQRLLGLMGI